VDLLFVCFVPFLSFCSEKATVVLYFGQILNRLGVAGFQCFSLLLWLYPSWFSACSKPPSRDDYCKVPYSRTQQRDERGSWT